MAAGYAWVVTKDYIHDDTPLADWGKLGKGVDVNVQGPGRATPEEIRKAELEGQPFRMYDDDGILYYSGRCWSFDGDGSEQAFGPLDDYGKPNAGATEIRYRDRTTGKWETL